jgi:hypothetical protein
MPPIHKLGVTVVTDQAPGQFFTLTYCAEKSGVKYEQFRRNQRDGTIPLACYTNSKGHQLFTFGQMEAIIHTYRAYRKREVKRSEIRGILDERWND